MDKIILAIKPGQKWEALDLKSQFLIAHLNPSSITRSYSALYSTASSPGSPIPHRQYQRGGDYTVSFNLTFDDYSDRDEILLSNGAITAMSCSDSIDWLHRVSIPSSYYLNDIGIENEPPVLLFYWGRRPIIEVDLTLGDISEDLVDPVTKLPMRASVDVTLTRVLPVVIRFHES